MCRIDGCVSSPLIQYMCKSVQSSFNNCSINTVYSCTLKLKWLGKGLLSLTKYSPISRTAVFLVYRRKRYLMKKKAAIVRKYLKQEKVVELPHPPYSPDLAPCDFFPIPEAQKAPHWKKISNAQKSRFGYFSVSEQYTSKRL